MRETSYQTLKIIKPKLNTSPHPQYIRAGLPFPSNVTDARTQPVFGTVDLLECQIRLTCRAGVGDAVSGPGVGEDSALATGSVVVEDTVGIAEAACATAGEGVVEPGAEGLNVRARGRLGVGGSCRAGVDGGGRGLGPERSRGGGSGDVPCNGGSVSLAVSGLKDWLV